MFSCVSDAQKFKTKFEEGQKIMEKVDTSEVTGAAGDGGMFLMFFIAVMLLGCSSA